MAFFIPSIQFFFGLPRVLFCFGIHFNAILASIYIYIYVWGNSPNKILCNYTYGYTHTYVYIYTHCRIFQETNVYIVRKINDLKVLLLPNSTQVQIPYLRTATNIVSVRNCLGFPMSLPFPHARVHHCDVDSRYLFVCASKMTALNERQNFKFSTVNYMVRENRK